MSELDKSLINLVHSLASSFPDYYTDEDVQEVIDEIAAKNFVDIGDKNYVAY